MAKTKEQKKKMLQNLEDLLKRAKSLVLIDYYGLKVKEVNQLRKSLKDANCRYLVAKKTLLKRALDKLGLKHIDIDKIIGGIGLIFGLEDEIMPIKLAVNFNKEHGKMKIHGGIFSAKGGEMEFVSSEKIKSLAKLPNREQLKAQVVWVINSPLLGFINVLQGNLRNLVYTLKAIQDKKS